MNRRDACSTTTAANPSALRHQHHGQTVPLGEKAAQVQRSGMTVGVIGIDVTNHVGREIDQRDDMAANVERWVAQADRGPQLLVDGVVKDAAVAIAGILNAIANARFQQRFFQTARTARAGMTGGESVYRFQAVMTGQRFERAPAAATRRPILDPIRRRDVDRRTRRRGGEHQQGEGDAPNDSEHTETPVPQRTTCLLLSDE